MTTTDVETATETPVELPIRHQLGKLLAGVIAGFIATKLIERGYDGLLASHRQKVTSTIR